MNALEPQIRQYCATVLDPLRDADQIDFVADLGTKMPMRVIGMLLGIPEADHEAIRSHADRGSVANRASHTSSSRRDSLTISSSASTSIGRRGSPLG